MTPWWDSTKDAQFKELWHNADLTLNQIGAAFNNEVSSHGLLRRAQKLGLPGRITTKQDPDREYLAEEAKKRNITPEILKRRIVQAVIKDRMIQAVLDDGVQ